MSGKNKTMITIKLILFDIGNVLVKLTGASIIQNNSREALTKRYVWETWTSIKEVQDFETGKLDPASFSRQIISFYDLKINSSEFIKLFRSAAETKFEGVDSFLRQLSENFELACLTNTNPIQWPKIKDEFGLGKHFNKRYVSYEIGLMKPDKNIYKYVLEDTGLLSHEILFVDDNYENIDSATNLGFQCCHVDNFQDAKNKINEIVT